MLLGRLFLLLGKSLLLSGQLLRLLRRGQLLVLLLIRPGNQERAIAEIRCEARIVRLLPRTTTTGLCRRAHFATRSASVGGRASTGSSRKYRSMSRAKSLAVW